MAEFVRGHNITLFRCGSCVNQEPFVKMPDCAVREALSHILDESNHPVLVHCDRGTRRTSVVVGCLRKVQSWSLTSVFDEYRRFAGKQPNMLDLQYIERFDASRRDAFAGACSS